MAYYRAGLGNAASYQVSGKPFASGSISAPSGSPKKVEFPSVTRWVLIQNHDETNDLYCSFSEAGLPPGDNHFMIADAGSLAYMSGPRMEIKVTEMWFEGSTDFDVIAGLTGIEADSIIDNWSGSAGVG
tara:strand:+ start:4721 stop:5107 length:387 start_codon:yes stop_codon:yes gene_type:complete